MVWASLRNQVKPPRTVLVTGASTGDDATPAALDLAAAAVRLDSGPGLILVLESAMHGPYMPEAPASSVRIMAPLTLSHVRSVLAQVTNEFGFIIVVAAAPQQSADCVAIATMADAVVMVARSGRTHFAEARLAAELLRQAGVTVAAALLTRDRRSVHAQPQQGRSSDALADLRLPTERREAAVGIELFS